MYRKMDQTFELALTVLLFASLNSAGFRTIEIPSESERPIQTQMESRAPDSLVADVSAPWTLDEILSALRDVETGGTLHGGRRAIGDDGAAIGPFQIHRAYWEDAGVPGCFADCDDLEYSRAVVLAYWSRYCPRALQACEAEVLVRTHNGGPKGPSKRSTLFFWRRVESELRKLRLTEFEQHGTWVTTHD